MFCPKCGTKLEDGTKFCTECGASLQPALDAIREKEVPAPIPPSDNPIPNGVKPKKKTGLIVGITALLAVLIVGGIFAFMSLKPVKTYPVNVQINAEGLDVSTGTKVPLHVSGTTASNKKVDNTYYVGTSDSDFELEPGTYTFSVEASPIAADGTIYATENVSTSASLSDEGALATDEELTLTPIFADEVTDEQINAAYEAAKEGGAESAEKADELKQAAEAKRDTALEEAASKTASGNSENVFQVAEILAMDPTEISAYLQSQGAQQYDATSEDAYLGVAPYSWDISLTAINTMPSELLSGPVAIENAGSMLLGSSLGVGRLTNDAELDTTGEQILSADMLNAGTAPTDIVISTGIFARFDNDSILNLLDNCKFPSEGYASYSGALQSASATYTSTSYVGNVMVNGETHYWYVLQFEYASPYNDSDSYPSTRIGCLSQSTCSRLFESEFSGVANWNDLDDSSKLDYLSKALVQADLTGNGGYRLNTLTGEIQEWNDGAWGEPIHPLA